MGSIKQVISKHIKIKPIYTNITLNVISYSCEQTYLVRRSNLG